MKCARNLVLSSCLVPGLVLALHLEGCSAPAGSKRTSSDGSAAGASGSGRIVPREELPERERALWDAWRAGGPAWEVERSAAEADPALAAFLVDNLVRELVRSFDRAKLARVGQAPGSFERAQSELARMPQASLPVLVELLCVPDGIVAFLAADTLRAIGAPAVDPTAVLLRHPVPETRRRAAELLADLPTAGAADSQVLGRLAELGAADPEWIVRAQALRAIGQRGARLEHKGFALGVLLRGLRDPDAAVSESAAEAIGVLDERRAIPRLIEVLPELADAGAVRAAAGVQRSLKALARDDRERSLAEWRAYWTVNEARILAEIRANSPARH